MKKIVSILILFIILGGFNAKYTYATKQIFSVHKADEKVKSSLLATNTKVFDADSSSSVDGNRKKNNRKALKLVPFGISSKSIYIIKAYERLLVTFTNPSYHYFSFSDYRKRGPPNTIS